MRLSSIIMEKKEERIRAIALSYYTRKDVQNAIYEFSKNREVSPRYFEGFGKRPDSFQYPSDILSFVKKGATSFHCSEEIWEDPLELSTDLNQDQLNKLRKGWDLIIDIDCKWIYYSKKAALAIIKALENHGVKNIGIKFSGSKGFHIIIPWQAFPEYIDEIKTKEMFPEWPRAILNYIKEISRPILQNMIKDTDSDFLKVQGFIGIKCETCSNIAEERFQITVRCPKCHPPHIETFKSSSQDFKQKKCPTCKSIMEETQKKKFYFCQKCSTNSLENPSNFNEELSVPDIFKVLGLDVLLVSSRHLFRMPYSLHEKTSLVSIVLTKEELEKFELTDADPLKIKISNYLPEPKKDEARKLLIQAIDWYRSNSQQQKLEFSENPDKVNKIKKDFPKINIKDVKEENYPPAIIKILKGMEDGRKRALFILLNFFRSLGLSIEEVEKKVNEWNVKNNPPLKQGYINSQLIWHSKHSPVLPPNFDNDIYKEIGVYDTDNISEKVKNPVAYVSYKSGAWKTNQDQNKPKREKIPRAPRKKKESK